MPEPIPVLDARVRPLNVAVLRWIAVGGVVLGGHRLVELTASSVHQLLQFHTWPLMPRDWYAFNVLALAATACCWVVGGIGLLRLRAFAPALMRVASWMCIVSMTWWFFRFALDMLSPRFNESWHGRIFSVLSNIEYFLIHIFYAVSVLLVLRHPEVRLTFAQQAGGFQPILTVQENAT
jgi:hypothetical protein